MTAIYENENTYEEEDSLMVALTAQFQRAPWYASSLIFHIVLFLFIALFTPPPQDKPEAEYILTEIIDNPPIIEDDEIIKPIPPEPIDKTDDNTDIMPDQITVNTADPIDVQMDEIDVEPTDSVEQADNINESLDYLALDGGNKGQIFGKPGNGSGKGRGSLSDIRDYNRKKPKSRMERVLVKPLGMALRWLAAHQEADGHWDNVKYGGGKSMPAIPGQYDTASTSLALLSFLGAGNSSKRGRFRENVKAAQDWLVRQMQPSGQVGKNFRYEGALGMMALVEAYGMSEDSNLKAAAQAAVDFAVAAQNESGGWDYSPNSRRTDTSPTGWWLMGLKSAKISGLKVPKSTFTNAKKWFNRACKDDGRVLYAENSDGAEANWNSPTMAAAGLACRLFMNYPATGGIEQAIAARLLKSPKNGPLPTLQESPEKTYFYLWYYETMAFYNMGPKIWKQFAPLLYSEVVKTQVTRGTFKGLKGSWNPPKPGKHSTWHGDWQWGRVGQTAVAALMLEVHDRF